MNTTTQQKPKVYQRKTKDVYVIMWNGEEVDSTEEWSNAKYLRDEYNMAFKGGVSIKKQRQTI